MVDVTDITGIGPAKAETLAENGYDSVEAIAEAEQDELAEVDGVGDDRALEFIVGANDVLDESLDESDGDSFDLTPSEVSEELEDGEDSETSASVDSVDEDDEPVVESEESTEDESEESDGPETYEVVIDFGNKREYDVFHAALMRHHENIYTSKQPAADAMEKCLEGLDDFECVSYELTEEELNELHSAILQQRINYQGDNLIDHMDYLREIEYQIDDARDEYLFE